MSISKKPFSELEDRPSGPLAGVTILDLTSVVFGAYATQILADLGCDVIKIESPDGPRGEGGDIMRWAGTAPSGASDLGPIFTTINRNKKSILLDLNDAEAKQVMHDLIASSDVIASTVRYEGMKRLGLSYDDVKAINPSILYVHGSGYGADGPRAGEPAYDDLIQAASGCADLLPRVDGDAQPRYLPTLVADKVAGLFMSQAIMAGLYHRKVTGEGQFVEVPMFECVTSFTLAEHMFGQVFDPPTGPWAYTRLANPNRRPFRTKDGYVGLLPYSVGQWRRFFKLAAQTHLIEDPRFASQTEISANISVLYEILERVTVDRTTGEWIELLKSKGIAAVPVNRLEDLPFDEHLSAVDFFQQYLHPEAGSYRSMRSPMLFSKTPANIRLHPPRLGQHTEEIVARTRRAASTASSAKQDLKDAVGD